MTSDLQTDEYTISLGREMVVCTDMIRRARQRLARFEAEFGMTTEQMLQLDRPAAGAADPQHLSAWRDEHQGLLAWSQRLRDYEAAYRRLK